MDVMTIIAKAYGRPLSKRREANAKSVAMALSSHGAKFGLLQPHRLAQYLAQLFHESAAFQYDREVWGPTAAQKRYEGRRDLGNTQKGDGKKYSGHGPIQVTGRANTTEFFKWCVANFPNLTVPDFVANPKLINTDPWEGLTAIWYWSTRKLNRYADSGDIEMITRRINGGLNGYQDRLDWYDRISLVMLGYQPTDIKGAQKALGVVVDGVSGPRTRAAFHKALVSRGGLVSPDIQDAPVVQDKPVVPDEVETEVKKQTGLWGRLMALIGGGGATLAWLADQDWMSIIAIGGVGIAGLVVLTLLGPRLAKTIRSIKETVEA